MKKLDNFLYRSFPLRLKRGAILSRFYDRFHRLISWRAIMLFFSKDFGLSAGFCLQILLRAQFTYFVRINICHQINRHFLQKIISGSFAIKEFPFETLQNDCSRLFRHARPVSRHHLLNCYYFYQTSHSSLSRPKYHKTYKTVGKHETVTRPILDELSHFIIAPFTQMIKK